MVAKKVVPLVVVVGETASGKSDLAMTLAREFYGEIISADSWTVRREVNIGTAKPGKVEQALVKHHMIDIVAPCKDFTAAVYKRMAIEKIKNINSRGKLPILAGGTGLYVDGVIYDFGFLPEGEKGQRERLNNLSIRELIQIATRKGLPLVDIDTRNKRRIIRLIETGGQRPSRGTLRPNTLIIGIKLGRDDLRARVEQRTDNMIKNGLEQEVEALANTYGWGCEALKGIGYSEWREYFLGSQSLEETKDRIISSTMGLAKRQRTWLKRNKSIQWVNNPSEAVELVTTFLNKIN